jgi:putative Holliday junction resolvase
MGKMLCVDPGDTRIGIAISDLSATLARPLSIIPHKSRNEDAERIAKIAEDNDVEMIIIGQSLDENGEPTAQGRKSTRLMGVITSISNIPVLLWDEYRSTQLAMEQRSIMGKSRNKREKPVDDEAAAMILQDFLDHERDLAGSGK